MLAEDQLKHKIKGNQNKQNDLNNSTLSQGTYTVGPVRVDGKYYVKAFYYNHLTSRGACQLVSRLYWPALQLI